MYYTTSRQVIVTLPNEARGPAVQLGWWQLGEAETGAFAIDNVLLGPSVYGYGSNYSDTYVIISLVIMVSLTITVVTALSLVAIQTCGGRYLMEQSCHALVANQTLSCLKLI